MTNRSVAWTVGITAVAAVAIGVGIEGYVRTHHRAGGGEPGPSANYSKALGLTGEQAAKVQALESSYVRDLAAVREGMTKDRMALCGLFAAERWDRKAIDRTAARVAAGQARQQTLVVNYLGKIRATLTAEQRAKFSDLIMEDLCAACRTEGASQGCICPSGSGHQCGHHSS